VTICREWTLVKTAAEMRAAKLLLCRSWSCDYCRPRRRAQLMAKAAAGRPVRFLTLTVNPAVGQSPADRLRQLANAWRIIVKRLRRRTPDDEVEFLAVVEETKNGEPHLHILLRSPFIPQALLSAWMGELIQAPVVDIRAVRSASEVVRYIAKYVAKQPKQFDGMKRYWSSQRWEGPREPPEPPQELVGASWRVETRSLAAIASDWLSERYAFSHRTGDVVHFTPDNAGARYILTVYNIEALTRPPPLEPDN